MTIATIDGHLVELFERPDGKEPPWQSSPAWGQQRLIQRNEIAGGQPATVFGPLVWPGPPQVRTVQAGLQYDPNVANWPAGSTGLGRAFSLIGILEIGTGGSSQTAEFDWGNGVQLTAPATALRVSVRADNALTDSIPDQLYALCTIGTSAVARLKAPTRTFPIAPLGSGGPIAESGPIPRFARAYSWTAINGAADPLVLVELYTGPPGAGGFLIAQYTAAQLADPYLRGQFTPIPEGARFWKVSGPALSIVYGSLAFSLDL